MAQARATQLDLSGSRTSTKKRRRGAFTSLSMSAVTSYFGVFLMVMALVAISYQAPQRQAVLASTDMQAAGASVENNPTSAVDKVMATSVAATIAETADMPVSQNVANLSTSLTIESLLAQNDTNTISKPQIVQPSADSRTIQKYTSVAGDTIPTIAQKFNVSAQTIKWANKVSSDAIEPGRELAIPPVDGVIYTVREGDTIDTIAQRYKADKNYLMTFNDLELTGNPAVGSQIIIPSGQLPTEEQPGYVAPRTTTYSAGVNYGSYGASSASGSARGWGGGRSPGNLYGTGQCTFYAFERRLQLGRPIGGQWGNANTWAYSGAVAGFRVDGNPAPGAIMQNGGGYGHVAIVESVVPGVSVSISEMNGYRWGGGWNRVGYGTISWGEATSGMYKYIH